MRRKKLNPFAYSATLPKKHMSSQGKDDFIEKMLEVKLQLKGIEETAQEIILLSDELRKEAQNIKRFLKQINE